VQNAATQNTALNKQKLSRKLTQTAVAIVSEGLNKWVVEIKSREMAIGSSHGRLVS
jgi:hypothetical protein